MLKKAFLGIEKVSRKVNGESVVLRVDWNVPLQGSKITDGTRVAETVATLKHLQEGQPRSIVILSHLGRPKGRDPKLSFKPLVGQLEQLCGAKLNFLDSVVSDESYNAVMQGKGKIFLGENIRFHPEEENSKAPAAQVKAFDAKLTRLGNLYVNDAFGASHRGNRSIVGVHSKLRVGGLLMRKEVEHLAPILDNPVRPLTFLLGGAKVNDKLKLIRKVIDIADNVMIGGGMSYTFLKRQGKTIGDSLFDEKGYPDTEVLIEQAKKLKKNLLLPVDAKYAKSEDGEAKIADFENGAGIPDGFAAWDNGPATVARFSEVLKNTKTLVWNGPLGYIENPEFRKASQGMLEAIIRRTGEGMVSIVGGGDTLTVISGKPGSAAKLTHVSTGGGATLELLQGNDMPGINVLHDLTAVPE